MGIVCFLNAKCAGEKFGISFMRIRCVCGELWWKRSSDRNRSLCFFLTVFFSFASVGLKLGQHVLAGTFNKNLQKFSGSGYSQEHLRTRIPNRYMKNCILCGNDVLNVGDIEYDVKNNFPRPGSGTRPGFPRTVLKFQNL